MRIDTSKLKKIVSVLNPCIAKENTVPILQCFHFQNTYATAYNLEVGCIYNHGIISENEFDYCIPFGKFKAFVANNTNEFIDFEVSNDILAIRSGRSYAKIPLENPEDFPQFDRFLEQKNPDNLFNINQDFINGLKLCNNFVSLKISNFALHGVFINGKKIYATDMMRIAEYTHEFDYDINLIIPFELIKVISDCDKLCLLDNQIAFLGENIIYFSGLIEGDYPNCVKVLGENTKDLKKLIKLPKDDLRKGLKKLGNFSEEMQGNATCEIQFGKEITIKYEGQIAKIEEIFSFGSALPEKSINLNPYLLDRILVDCDSFAFTDRVLYGISKDKKFRCILSLKAKN